MTTKNTRPQAANAIEGTARIYIDRDLIPQRIRTVRIGEKCWFVAADVCKALGLRKTSGAPTILQRLSSDDLKAIPPGVLKSQGARQACAVSERGVRDVLARSRLPNAGQLQRWLSGEKDYHLRPTAENFDQQQAHLLAVIAEQERTIQNLQAQLSNKEAC